MKFKQLIILIAISSLLLLYGVSLISQPTQVELSSLSDYNGQQVVVQGIVTMYRTTTFGSQLITIRGDDIKEGTAVIYIDGEVPVEYGDKIQAVGQVQRYKNQWEITVANPQRITILQTWRNQTIPLRQLAENPQRYLNTNVNVTGILSQKQSSSFQLTEQGQLYSLAVRCPPSALASVSENDTIAILGRFVYDPCFFHFILEITGNTHAIMNVEAGLV